MSNDTENHYNRPLFEHMPILSDEAVWDLMELMHGLIDAYEEHYAEALQRLRNQRYQELHEHCHDERQMNLPMEGISQDPF